MKEERVIREDEGRIFSISQPQIHATFTYQRTRKAIQQKKHENFES
jgi:hypothetical protein